MFNKILIANRGEVAVRIIRSCKNLGIKTVSIYSYDDKNSMHVYLSDEALCIGDSINAYLDIKSILNAAKLSGANAIHPGYGFLSENPDFVRLIEKNKIAFIGPRSTTIRQLGNKNNALTLAKIHNLNILPSYIWSNDNHKNETAVRNIGYPFIIKPIYGGGGKGIRIIKNKIDLSTYVKLSQQEAELSYKNNKIYMEKYLENARHIEFQMICDKNDALMIGNRECSIQDKYQKIIEETPVNNIKKKHLDNITKICEIFFSKLSYFNLGTIEFLYENNVFYFLEVNPRLQVEHTITESKRNIDLVKIQIELAYTQKINISDLNLIQPGCYIQCRINMRNYNENKIKFLHIPGGIGIRFDSHIYNGYKIPLKYDKLIGKLIAYGKSRNETIRRLLIALDEIIIYNIDTNINELKKILYHDMFKKQHITTRFLEKIIE